MFDAVRNFITNKEAAVFSASNPGEPIAYTLRYLDDRSLARMSYSVTYGKKDCNNINRPAPIWTRYVSEETGPVTCPIGYAVAGARCTGRYCDNKNLLCVAYEPEEKLHERQIRWSHFFSEENPPNNSAKTTNGFVSGVNCSGRYCDNVSLQWFTSPYIQNTAQCITQEQFSEEVTNHKRNEDQCADGWFVAGITCTGRYCDNISLTCCRAR